MHGNKTGKQSQMKFKLSAVHIWRWAPQLLGLKAQPVRSAAAAPRTQANAI